MTPVMSPPPYDAAARAATAEWLAGWARNGPLLEERRLAELRQLTDADVARIAVELVWPMALVGPGDDGEGLVAIKDALKLLTFVRTHGHSACLIGGIAVSRWGEPRTTKDVDATVLVPFRHEAEMMALLLTRFLSRDSDPARRAELGRLALLRASNGVDLDISFAAFPFELEVLERATDWQVTPDIALRTCSAEDLVLYKLIAARLIDLHDVQSIVSRMGKALDVDRIRLWGGRFAEILENPELLAPFETALRRPGRLR
jgi:hypothetical protein